jgi:uncharacterized membrane protein
MLMIALRLLHILLGVFWAGGAFVTASFLLPSAQAAGPGAGPMMRQLIVVRKMPVVIMFTAILTVLSGFGMYWYDNSRSNGSFARSAQGMTLGLGGVVALLTLGVGMGVITPAGKKLTELLVQSRRQADRRRRSKPRRSLLFNNGCWSEHVPPRRCC